jgi:hypothetical protein
LAITAVSAGLQMYGQISGSRAAAGQYKAQAAANEIQAQQSEVRAAEVENAAYLQAAQTRSEAMDQARAIRKAAENLRSTGRAAFASAGVKVDAPGSTDAYQQSILYDSEADAGKALLSADWRGKSIEKGGQLDARSLRDTATNLRMGASNARSAAGDATRAGYINAFGTVLGAAASYTRWQTAMQPKP